MQPCLIFAWIIIVIVSFFSIYQLYNYNRNKTISNIFVKQNNNIVPISHHVETNFCNIERRTDVSLSTEEFRDTYAGKKPVVIVHTLRKNRNERFQRLTTFDNILETYGDLKIILSTANSYTKIKRTASVKEYLYKYLKTTTLDSNATDVFYWFGDNYKVLRKLTDQFRINNYAGAKYNTPSFGVGGKLSGVPFHFHGGGFSEVIHGRKRWWLYKKKLPFNGNETQLQWLHSFYPKVVQDLRSNNNNNLPSSPSPSSTTPSMEDEGLLECTIKFGEALYFPSHWYHATLNLNKYTAFVSTFTDGEDKMSYGDVNYGGEDL